MKFQGENCVLNMASYFNRSGVLLNGTFWVSNPTNESGRYRQPWLRFTHTLQTSENETLRDWLQAIANGKAVDPLPLSGAVRQIARLETNDSREISLSIQYDHAPEPVWWAWDITSPLMIRLDIPHNEFTNLITVFDEIEWSFY